MGKRKKKLKIHFGSVFDILPDNGMTTKRKNYYY